jgi:hypothetical protein
VNFRLNSCCNGLLVEGCNLTDFETQVMNMEKVSAQCAACRLI